MFLENVCIDTADPQRLGRFWAQALGTTTAFDTADYFETRLTVDGGPTLDLCLPKVEKPSTAAPRLHLDLRGGEEQDAVVERLLALGATRADIGQGDVPWVVLADPDAQPFCVMEERETYRDTGPIAAIPVRGGDPRANAAFWAEFSGWLPYDGGAPAALRHPSGRGPVLEFFPEDEPKQDKNRMHLDLRLEPSDDLDTMLARAHELGGSRYEHDWGDLPWTVLADPGGTGLCFLPARSS
jgi:hypothetical protein